MVEAVKSFLICDDDDEVREAIAEAVKHFYKDARVYTASDGSEAMQKLRNAPPSLVIIDLDMPKVTGVEMIEQMQRINSFSRIPIIVMSGMDPDSENVLAVRAKGIMFAQKPFKTQYLMGLIEGVFSGAKIKSASTPESRKLVPGEILFKEGDTSGSLFLVKSGKLQVYKEVEGTKKIIAEIGANQLVGEMAFIDKKPRSATVEAMDESELIDLPLQDVDTYLNNQPVWLRTLINTLLSRLRAAIREK